MLLQIHIHPIPLLLPGIVVWRLCVSEKRTRSTMLMTGKLQCEYLRILRCMATFDPPVPSRRALAMFNREERAKRENQILSDFRSMVHKKISKQKT